MRHGSCAMRSYGMYITLDKYLKRMEQKEVDAQLLSTLKAYRDHWLDRSLHHAGFWNRHFPKNILLRNIIKFICLPLWPIIEAKEFYNYSRLNRQFEMINEDYEMARIRYERKLNYESG